MAQKAAFPYRDGDSSEADAAEANEKLRRAPEQRLVPMALQQQQQQENNTHTTQSCCLSD